MLDTHQETNRADVLSQLVPLERKDGERKRYSDQAIQNVQNHYHIPAPLQTISLLSQYARWRTEGKSLCGLLHADVCSACTAGRSELAVHSPGATWL